MKDYLSELVRQASDALRARNSLREYLQARILAAFQSRGAMIPLAFHGGTALRFVYGSRRFSEDLDFALERAHDPYDFPINPAPRPGLAAGRQASRDPPSAVPQGPGRL